MDNSFLYDANMFARQGMGQGPRWPSGKKGPRVQREPTGRAIIVINIERVTEREETEREMSREREREREKKRDV